MAFDEFFRETENWSKAVFVMFGCGRGVHVCRLTDFSGQLKGFNYSLERCLRSFVPEVAAKHAQLDAKSSVTSPVC